MPNDLPYLLSEVRYASASSAPCSRSPMDHAGHFAECRPLGNLEGADLCMCRTRFRRQASSEGEEEREGKKKMITKSTFHRKTSSVGAIVGETAGSRCAEEPWRGFIKKHTVQHTPAQRRRVKSVENQARKGARGLLLRFSNSRPVKMGQAQPSAR